MTEEQAPDRRLGRLEAFAAVTGAVGAFMVASNSTATPWGFAVMLASSLSWIFVGRAVASRALVFMNSCFTLINLVGIRRWLL